MPEDNTNNMPHDPNGDAPKPPTNPVEFSRWVQRPRVNPKKPKVQPDDSAMRLKPMDKPEVNRSIGTDQPKRSKTKTPIKHGFQPIYGQTRAVKQLLRAVQLIW